ncbi:hypothetical protein [Microbacterium xylanilyticum]
MSHPLRDLIANRVAQRDEDLIPLPKYMLAVTIAANTLDELHNAVDQLSLDFMTEWRDREQIESTDGRMSVVLDVTSQHQTPERYAEQLAAWSSQRRTNRTIGAPGIPSCGRVE